MNKKILFYLTICIHHMHDFLQDVEQVLLFKETYSWRTPWARSHRCHVGGCRQIAGGCLDSGDFACCPCHQIQNLPCHLHVRTTGGKTSDQLTWIIYSAVKFLAWCKPKVCNKWEDNELMLLVSNQRMIMCTFVNKTQVWFSCLWLRRCNTI